MEPPILDSNTPGRLSSPEVDPFFRSLAHFRYMSFERGSGVWGGQTAGFWRCILRPHAAELYKPESNSLQGDHVRIIWEPY